MRLPGKDSSTYRGIITGGQAFVAAGVVFATGLIGVIQGIPGCGEAVVHYLQQNAVQYAALLGIPAGIVSFLFNVFFRKDVENY